MSRTGRLARKAKNRPSRRSRKGGFRSGQGPRSSAGESAAALAHEALDVVEHDGIRIRLAKQHIDAGVGGLGLVAFFGTDHDHGDVRRQRVLAHVAGQLKAVHAGHFDVGDQHVGHALGDLFHRIEAIFGHRHLKLIVDQQAVGFHAHDLGVVRDHDHRVGSGFRHDHACRGGRGGWSDRSGSSLPGRFFLGQACCGDALRFRLRCLFGSEPYWFPTGSLFGFRLCRLRGCNTLRLDAFGRDARGLFGGDTFRFKAGGLFGGNAFRFRLGGLFCLQACRLGLGAALGFDARGLFGGKTVGFDAFGFFSGKTVGFDAFGFFGGKTLGFAARRIVGGNAVSFALGRFNRGDAFGFQLGGMCIGQALRFQLRGVLVGDALRFQLGGVLVGDAFCFQLRCLFIGKALRFLARRFLGGLTFRFQARSVGSGNAFGFQAGRFGGGNALGFQTRGFGGGDTFGFQTGRFGSGNALGFQARRFRCGDALGLDTGRLGCSDAFAFDAFGFDHRKALGLTARIFLGNGKTLQVETGGLDHRFEALRFGFGGTLLRFACQAFFFQRGQAVQFCLLLRGARGDGSEAFRFQPLRFLGGFLLSLEAGEFLGLAGILEHGRFITLLQRFDFAFAQHVDDDTVGHVEEH